MVLKQIPGSVILHSVLSPKGKSGIKYGSLLLGWMAGWQTGMECRIQLNVCLLINDVNKSKNAIK